MKIRVVIAGILAALIMGASAMAQGEALKGGAITRDENLVTLGKALDIAMSNNLDIQQARTDRAISNEKLKEAVSGGRPAFGFSGNVVKTLGGQDISIPLHYHIPAAMTAINPMTGATQPVIATNVLTGATSPLVAGNAVTQNVAFSKSVQGSLGFVVKQPVWTFGRIQNNIKLNRNSLKTSDLGLRRTQLEVGLKVRQSYYQYLLAIEFYQVSENTLAQAMAHHGAAKSRFDVGATPKFDLIRAEVDVATAKENLTRAQKGVDLARMALNNVMGIDVNAPTRVTAPDPQGEIAPTLDQMKALAEKNRPELKQLQLGQDSALLGSRMARLLPVIGFQGTYQIVNQGSAFAQQDTWQLVLAGEIPVFDSGKARAQEKQALGTREKLRQTEAQLRDGIALQVSEAWLSLNEARARKSTSAAILAQAEEAVRMAETGYKEGVTTNLDVIDAQHGLNGARLNEAMARFDYETAAAKLLSAVGVDSIEELNSAVK